MRSFSVFILSITFCLGSRAQLFDTAMWVPNGPVHDMVKYGNEMILGGDFNYVGKAIGYGIPIDTTDLQILSPDFPRVDGEIYCVEPDCWGGWYIGGKFNMVGGQARTNLAHIARSGYLYPNFDPKPDGPVYALWVTQSPRAGVFVRPDVYVGGDFTYIGGTNRDNLAVLNPYDGLPYVNWKTDVAGPVYCISPKTQYSTRWGELNAYFIYIGGDFVTVDGISRTYFAELTQMIGNVMGSHILRPLNIVFNGPVRTIKHTFRNIYIGGEFTMVNSQQRKFFIKYNTIANALSLAFNPDVSGPVYCQGRYGLFPVSSNGGPPPPGIVPAPVNDDEGAQMLLRNGSFPLPAYLDSSIFIGGSFATVNGQARSNFAEIDTLTGTVMPLIINTDGKVNAIEISKRDNDIYLGGEFKTVNGQPRRHFAALDSVGVVRPQFFDLSDPVRGLALNDTLIYVGGEFVCFNGSVHNNLAAIDLTTKMASAFSHGTDRYVTSLALTPGNLLFVGGDFHALSSQPRDHVGGIDLNTNTVLPLLANTDGLVRTLCVLNNKLYFGGLFTEVNNIPRLNVAAIDFTSNQLLNWLPNANGTVNSMKPGTDKIWVGGFYSSIGGFSRNNLASVDTLGGYCITSFNPNVSNGVYSIAVNGLRLNLGGWFTQVNSTTRNNTAAIDGNSALVLSFDPNPNNFIRSIYEVNPSTLVLGGQFTQIGGQPRNRMAFVDQWSGTVLPLDPNANNSPLCYNSSGTTLFTGGSFTAMNQWVHPFFVAMNTQYVPGYNEIQESSSLLVYPNPATDQLHVLLPKGLSDALISVYDLNGKRLMHFKQDNSPGLSLDVSAYTPGLYFVVITTPIASFSSRFLVVR